MIPVTARGTPGRTTGFATRARPPAPRPAAGPAPGAGLRLKRDRDHTRESRASEPGHKRELASRTGDRARAATFCHLPHARHGVCDIEDLNGTNLERGASRVTGTIH